MVNYFAKNDFINASLGGTMVKQNFGKTYISRPLRHNIINQEQDQDITQKLHSKDDLPHLVRHIVLSFRKYNTISFLISAHWQLTEIATYMYFYLTGCPDDKVSNKGNRNGILHQNVLLQNQYAK